MTERSNSRWRWIWHMVDCSWQRCTDHDEAAARCQNGQVLSFFFSSKGGRALPIRDKVARYVKEFVFTVEALPAPSCRCNVRGLLTCQTPCRYLSSSHWNILRARCPWSRKSLLQNQSFMGSSFEVDSRSRALAVDSRKGGVTLLAGAESSSSNEHWLANRLVGNRFIATSSSDGKLKEKAHSPGQNIEIVDLQKRLVLKFGGSARSMTAVSRSRATQLRWHRSNCTLQLKK